MSSIEQCRMLYDKKVLPQCIFFFRPSEQYGIYSQWFGSEFTDDRMTYANAEQYMMAQKAILFGDFDVLEMVMEKKNPADIKKLGQLVKGFDQAVWDKEKFQIVLKGNILKFSQNRMLKESLLQTGDAVLIEASPYDAVWGIKLPSGSPGIENPYNWRGENLLGFAIMAARDIIRFQDISCC